MQTIQQFLERLFLRVQAKIGERIKLIRLTYSVIGLGFAIYTNSVLEKVSNQIGLPSRYSETIKNVTQYFEYVVMLFVLILIVQMIYVIGDILFGRRAIPPPPPPEKEVKFLARAAESYPNLAQLTALAVDEFEGDTMHRDVVKAAMENGCAVGLRIQDSKGNDIGFCDFYHLERKAFDLWLDGNVYERDLKLQDFESIDEAARRGDKNINLFVGALLLNSGNQMHDYHMAPLVVSAARAHLRRQLSVFKTVHIYASIFSRSGRRYAELQGMKPFRLGADRGLAGGGHDVFVTSFHPEDAENQYAAVSRQNLYMLQFNS